MRLGTMLPTWCTGENLVSAAAIREWARRADAAGFAGLWAIDHLVEPPTYNTSVLDNAVALSHAAAVTEGIPLGTSIIILPLRRTANVASRALALQHLAGRRVTLGLGAGYVPKEFEAVGVPLSERGPRFSEGLDVLKALLAGEASYDGRFHSFEGVRIDPVAEEPPRLLAGGDSNVEDGERVMAEPVLRRILAADGWIAPPSNPEKVAREWELIEEYADGQGVDSDTVDRVLLAYTHLSEAETTGEAHAEQRPVFEELYSPDRGFDHAREHCLVGTIDDVLDRLAAYEAIGFDQVIAGPAAHDPDALDAQMTLLEEHVLPEFE